jgi:prepilin-type N-terminal cleavage/methylation domain-containing protein
MTRKSEKGFTLIEVLVVVSILAVLMGLVTVLVSKAGKSRYENDTKQLMAYLYHGIERYMTEFRQPPAMTVAGLNKIRDWKSLQADNTTNETAECLLVCLRRPDFSTPIEEGSLPGDKPIGNTDGDNWNKVPAGFSSSDPDAVEIHDAWGNPIVYIHWSAYETAVAIVNYQGAEVEVRAGRKPDDTFYRPTGYQLISVGENGKQDEDSELGDDIMNFATEKGGE